MMRVLCAVVVLLALFRPGLALAHESQPGNLELKQLDREQYKVVWRAPIYYGRPHPARLQLPAGWQVTADPVRARLSDSIVEKQIVAVAPAGFDGSRVEFPGLAGTVTDVFVRVARLDGTSFTAIARPTRPWAVLQGARAWYAVAGGYLGLGYQHILMGVDHLLFVLGLLLIVGSRRMLVKTITAFTAAHSITLGLCTLGLLSVPLPPLNAAVALSILFLGPEIVRCWRDESSLTLRQPWVVAFLFGLLHGCGFASGLTTAGLLKAEIPQALLWFNGGVELGQLTFVLLVVLIQRSIRTLDFRPGLWWRRAPGYLVGSCGAFWVIDRTLAMFI